MMTVVDKSTVPELLTRLRELESHYVRVGVLSKSGNHIMMIANVHEFGTNIKVTPKMRAFFRYQFGVNLKPSTTVIKIPERSFVRSSYDAKKGEIGDTGEELITQVVNGNLSARSFYEILGQTCADTIRNWLISNVNSPPNADLTIKNKGSSNPLVDTGQLSGSITYEVI